MGANCCTNREDTTDAVHCETRSTGAAPMAAPERRPLRIDDYTSSPRHRPLRTTTPEPTAEDLAVSPGRRSTKPEARAHEPLLRETAGGGLSARGVTQRSAKSEKVQFNEEVDTHRYSERPCPSPKISEVSLGELLLRTSGRSSGRSSGHSNGRADSYYGEMLLVRPAGAKMRGTALCDFYDMLGQHTGTGEESMHIDELAGRDVSEYWHTGRATTMSIRPTNIIRRINGYSVTSARSTELRNTEVRRTRAPGDEPSSEGEETELPEWSDPHSMQATSSGATRQAVRGSEDMPSIRMSDFSLGTCDSAEVPLGTPREVPLGSPREVPLGTPREGGDGDRPLGTPRIDEERRNGGMKSENWSDKLRRWSIDSSRQGGRASHRLDSDMSVVEELPVFASQSDRTDGSGKSKSSKRVEDLYDTLLGGQF